MAILGELFSSRRVWLQYGLTLGQLLCEGAANDTIHHDLELYQVQDSAKPHTGLNSGSRTHSRSSTTTVARSSMQDLSLVRSESGPTWGSYREGQTSGWLVLTNRCDDLHKSELGFKIAFAWQCQTCQSFLLKEVTTPSHHHHVCVSTNHFARYFCGRAARISSPRCQPCRKH